jgi:hypothetical protein
MSGAAATEREHDDGDHRQRDNRKRLGYRRTGDDSRGDVTMIIAESTVARDTEALSARHGERHDTARVGQRRPKPQRDEWGVGEIQVQDLEDCEAAWWIRRLVTVQIEIMITAKNRGVATAAERNCKSLRQRQGSETSR